jgi:hypothetical protein
VSSSRHARLRLRLRPPEYSLLHRSVLDRDGWRCQMCRSFSATGMLSGTPSQPGTFRQVVTVTDSASVIASASLTLTVMAPLAISTASLPSSTVGGTYSAIEVE